jgi:hypothetical protein
VSLDLLAADLAALSKDPLRFVLWAFPWGEAGTELEGWEGPEAWQRRILSDLRDGLLTPSSAIQLATASGHGVGKSALVAWIILWAISTFEDTRGVVTANTETQLKTKTWAELGKWHRLFLASDLFKLTATAIFSPDRERTWRIDMVPWSERNQEAFAGLHNQGKRLILVMDEASAIPDAIFQTSEGALTDANTEIIWAIFGNPTRNVGRFRECFPGGRHERSWRTYTVDSREVSFTNKTQIQKWIDSYGEDSDFVRIRVRGTFPRAGSLEFISIEDVRAAANREAACDLRDPLILGVDVARFGDNESVIFFRKGRDGRTHAPIRLREVDTQVLAARVADEFLNRRADAVFVDGGGVGGGVVDRLRHLHIPVVDVQFGASPSGFGYATGDSGVRYANKRAEMWGAMREWLKIGAIAPDSDPEGLNAQLIAPQYGLNQRGEIQLERKEDMRRRGLPSPDLADALALTFAMPVALRYSPEAHFGPPKPTLESEYDPFSPERMAA